VGTLVGFLVDCLVGLFGLVRCGGGILGSLATREPQQIMKIREFQAEQWGEVWGGSRGGTVREGV
jgi:hypothetical protein